LLHLSFWPSPAAQARSRALLQRSDRYRALALDPHICSRTLFFHAAHIVTRMLSFGSPTPFIAGLSATLEEINLAYAQRLRRHASALSLAEATRKFVELEQRHVENALRHLWQSSPAAAAEEVARMNRDLQRVASQGVVLFSPTYRIFHHALQNTRRGLGRLPDFGSQQHRQALGLEIACVASQFDLSPAAASVREP